MAPFSTFPVGNFNIPQLAAAELSWNYKFEIPRKLCLMKHHYSTYPSPYPTVLLSFSSNQTNLAFDYMKERRGGGNSSSGHTTNLNVNQNQLETMPFYDILNATCDLTTLGFTVRIFGGFCAVNLSPHSNNKN